MPEKMPDDFVARQLRTGPMTAHYELLALDPGSWYRFTRNEVGDNTAAFKSNLHGGARTRGMRAHTAVAHDSPGGVIACFYYREDES